MAEASLISECAVQGTYAKVRKLRLPSGLKVLLLDVEGPIVSTYVALATEADSDDGLPHTLEHLIFLGSEVYPFKGILDIYANRCYASGTNAWTDIDNTVYTLQTAGPQGTLTLLPVYMDHVLYPLLTDQGFTTEVHHINGEGEDAGVVYCEMQGRENDAESRCTRKLLQEIYEGTGYSFETGGIMENLRTSTTNKKIKSFHKQFYRPENISVIIAGQVDEKKVLEALKPIEEKISKKNEEIPLSSFVRPWQTPVPSLKGTKIIPLKYPNDTEECGLIRIGWRGPSTTDAAGLYELTACGILLRYLCETSIAPFQKALVEVENPYASDVTGDLIENSISLLVVSLENVPMGRLNEALPVLRQVIETISSETNSLDMDRMNNLIKKTRREFLSHIENKPHLTLALMCISDMLNASNEAQFPDRLNKWGDLQNLEKETCSWWESLLKKYLMSDFVAVIGQPSCELMTEMAKIEADRITDQREELGEEGLKKMATQLTDAMKFNNKEASPDVLRSVGVDNIDDLKRFSIKSWHTNGEECPYFDINKLPFYGRIHHMHSQFAYISLFLNTSSLSTDERLHLPLLLNVITKTSYYHNHCKMDYNILVEEIERLTNILSFSIGCKSNGWLFPGFFHNLIQVYAQCEPEKYDEVISLLWHILKKTCFDKRRVLIVAQKMVNDIATIRRQGDLMASHLIKVMISKKESNLYISSIIKQQKFLNNAISLLEKEEKDAFSFLDTLERIRNKLVSEENIWLHFGADLERNQFSTSPWDIFGAKEKCQKAFGNEDNYRDLLVEASERQGQGCIVGIGGLESSHLYYYIPGPTSFSDPDLPALYVATQYLTQLEGPMWRTIRGEGLAYGYSITTDAILGMIKFNLYKATHPVKALEKTKALFEPLLESPSWDENMFSASKSSLIFEIINKERSPSSLINQSLLNFLKNVDSDYNIKFVKSVANVTIEDAHNAAKKWLSGLFDNKSITGAIVCNPARICEIQDGLKNIGYDSFKIYKSLEESHLNPTD